MNQRESSKTAVVMGCGRGGLAIAIALAERGNRLTLLDTNPDALELIPAAKVAEGLIEPVLGDGTLARDLRKASVPDADVFIAVTGQDSSNTMACQIARHIFQVTTVICRVDDPARKEVYSELGLITVSATNAITEVALDAASG